MPLYTEQLMERFEGSISVAEKIAIINELGAHMERVGDLALGVDKVHVFLMNQMASNNEDIAKSAKSVIARRKSYCKVMDRRITMLRKGIVNALIDRLRNPLTRIEAIKALGKIDLPPDAIKTLSEIGIIKVLVDALENREYSVAINAAIVLRKIGSPEAIKPLILACLTRDNARVQAANILERASFLPDTVKELSEKSFVTSVSVLALKNADPNVKRIAAKVLIKLGLWNAAVDLLFNALFTNAYNNIAEMKDVIKELLETGLDEKLKLLLVNVLSAKLNDHNPLVRQETIKALGMIDLPEAVNALTAVLTTVNLEDRMFTAKVLVKMNLTEDVKLRLVNAILDAALTSTNYYVKRDVVKVLIQIDSPKVVEALVALLRVNPDSTSINAEAAQELGKMRLPYTVKALAIALKDSNYTFIQAIVALCEIGSPEAVNVLAEALTIDDYYHRNAAAEALVKIGSLEAVKELAIALKNANPNVKISAAAALAKISLTKDINALFINNVLAIALTIPNIREEVANELDKIGLQEDVVNALASLTGADPRVKRYAAEVLARMGLTEEFKLLVVNHILVSALINSDVSADASVDAAKALGRIGTPEAVNALTIVLTTSTRPYTKIVAATELIKIGLTENVKLLIIEVLAAELNSTYGDIRNAAAKILRKLRTPEAVGKLAAKLTDSDIKIRITVARELVKMDLSEALKREVIDKVVVVALTTNIGIAVNLALTLGIKTGAPEAVNVLAEALTRSTNHPNVRMEAANALAEIGTPEAANVLIAVLTRSTDRPDVRMEAANALAEIGTPEAANVLAAQVKKWLNPSCSDEFFFVNSVLISLEKFQRRLGVCSFRLEFPSAENSYLRDLNVAQHIIRFAESRTDSMRRRPFFPYFQW